MSLFQTIDCYLIDESGYIVASNGEEDEASVFLRLYFSLNQLRVMHFLTLVQVFSIQTNNIDENRLELSVHALIRPTDSCL